MGKVKGRKVSVYLSPEAAEAYSRLEAFARKTRCSVSALVSHAVCDEYFRQLSKVRVSAGAYALLASEEHEKLSSIKMESGNTMVIASESCRIDTEVKRLMGAVHLLGTGESEGL